MIDPQSGQAYGYVRAINRMPIVGGPEYVLVTLESDTGRNESYPVPLWIESALVARRGERIRISREILEEGWQCACPADPVQDVPGMLAEIEQRLSEPREDR